MKRYVRWQSLLLLGCVQVLACLAYTNTHHIRNSNPTITSAMKPLRRRSSFLQMASNDEVEFQQYLQRDDFESAFRILKRNPMIPVAPEYACKLLNHLDRLEDVSKAEDSQQKVSFQSIPC